MVSNNYTEIPLPSLHLISIVAFAASLILQCLRMNEVIVSFERIFHLAGWLCMFRVELGKIVSVSIITVTTLLPTS